MNVIEGGVTSAKGFYAASCEAEIKYKNRSDMAMIYSDVPCNVAGTFTTNVVKAAPVVWDMQVVAHGKAQAVVCNSGIANACTGEEGMNYCEQTANATAKALGVSKDEVLVASTGVIGMQLPIDRIVAGVEKMQPLLSGSDEAATNAAKAIMTTDTIKKEMAVTVELSNSTVTVGGMSKGSGMIHPNMCTMLGFITTDCNITQPMLQKAISDVVNDSFNMISVDGDTSTNDTCVILANGLANNTLIDSENDDFAKFKEALMYVACELAKKMAGDGEGATSLLEVTVKNASSKEEAVTLSKSVITSSLVKAAIYGADSNWGRIMCALGYSGVKFDASLVDIYYESENGHIQVVKNGMDASYDEEIATNILKADAVTVICDMKSGEKSATAWGCDLTYDYVKINADYRS